MNTYLWEESQNFINEVAKRAVMLVEALGMNTAQPSDLANTMPAYLLQRLHHPDADLNPSVTISTAQQCYPRERKRIVSDSCDLGEEISLLSNPYAGRTPARFNLVTKDERSSQKLELTKATRNAPVGDDNPMLSKTPEISPYTHVAQPGTLRAMLARSREPGAVHRVHRARPMTTNQSSKIVELAGEAKVGGEGAG
ncbi:hypothetical protein BT96DRAFT_1087311 [Gymnopus androsaceus JB14]|uniref:Uncharacterized protein n=1 Tax=Gymnopus androsaceus JB14 TaxID=1447944 RepID=A0A6A4GLB8_9AGAR|nr:hypothetical protein BT96DRAFT_1087311 [Gymnopus androsaceus JB14]